MIGESASAKSWNEHLHGQTLASRSANGTAVGLGDSSSVVLLPRAGCSPDRNTASSQRLQNRVVVESQLLSDGGAREPLFVQLGCDRDLGLSHSVGCINAVFGEDAGDSRAGDLELSGHGSDVADSEVTSNEGLNFVRSQLTGSPGSRASNLLARLCRRSEDQFSG